MNQGDSPSEIDVYRMILPALNHHMRSHGPDIIKFGENIPFADTLVQKLGSNFDTFNTKGSTIVKKKIDPKTQRIMRHIKNKLNNREK